MTRLRPWWSALAVAAAVAPAVAVAEPTAENTGSSETLAPNGWELGLGVGYSQGRGDFGDFETPVQDVADGGGGVQLEVAYRLRPRLAVGVYGTFARYARGDGADGDIQIDGATAGVLATVHLRPTEAVDPWLSVGAGWKGLWLDPAMGTTRGFHGVELARVQVGADVRASSRVAIAPVVGASVSTFVGQRIGTELIDVEEQGLQLTGYVGLAGRIGL